MRLWTWQNSDFSLANKQQKVKSIEFSSFLNDPTNSKETKEYHKAAYQKVWERLKTDQILWYFTQYEDAVSGACIERFEKRGCLLWEIDAPEDKIIKYCIAAWEYLRTGEPYNLLFDRPWTDLKALEPNKRNKLQKDFEEHWKDKNDQQLLDAMFLEKFANGCSAAIVFHPVEQYSVKIEKNPKIDGKWWEPPKEESKWKTKTMPCAQCPGRVKTDGLQ
jgi:hypothetical protein